MKPKKTRSDIIYEIERFSKKNYFFLLVFLGVIFLYFTYRVNKLEQQSLKNFDALNEKFNTVIAITDNGTIVEIESQDLLADQQEHIVSRILRNLVLARADITAGFSKSTYTNESIVSDSEKLKEFLQFMIIDNKEKGEKVFVKNTLTNKTIPATLLSKQALGYFDAYVESVKLMVQKNTLPHYASIIGTKIKEYVPKGKNFHIEVEYEVVLQYFDGFNEDKSMKFKTKKGFYTAIADGYFDIRTRSMYKKDSKFNGINKLGLHFYALKMILPVIED